MVRVPFWAGWVAIVLSGGCHREGRGEDSGDGPGTGAPSYTQTLGPDLVLVTRELAEPVIVPCDAVREVTVENRGAEDYLLDAMTVTPEDEARFGLAELLEIPRVLRAGSAVVVPMRISGAGPGTPSATVEVVSDRGTFSASFSVEVAFGDRRDEAFTTPLPAADIVLAVDHSAGMDAYRGELERGVTELLGALAPVSDWRLILVTADDGCANGGVFTAADRAAAEDWIGAHALDPEGTARTEALLELASAALAENSPSECNGAFQRAGAQLHVIAVSDEPEQSGREWSHWVDDYHDYADEIRVSAVADLGDDCGRGADGYADAASATGGALLDICQAGWGGRMGQLADAVDALPPAFPLAAPAVPASIVATISGQEVAASYDEEANAVIVPAAAAPGTAVAISYALPGICER